LAILYPIDFEYKGGTYLAQVEASDPEKVLDLWTKQISDEELVRWKADEGWAQGSGEAKHATTTGRLFIQY
jgi:hypothetical protein